MAVQHSYRIACVVVALSSSASAQYLMVPDTTHDVVMLFRRSDGALVTPNFIVDDASGVLYDLQLPTDALQVGSEVWVSDQVSDQVVRFDINGAYIATIAGAIDDLRGMELANGRVFVSNGGATHGAPGASLLMFNVNGTALGSFPAGDPRDILDFNGELLVAAGGSDDIDRFSYTGNYLGYFVNSNGQNGINLPAQLARNAAGHVLAAGIANASGLFEYDAVGTQLNYWPAGFSARGVAELDNGDLLYTDYIGVHVFNIASGISTDVITGIGVQYISPLNPPSAPVFYCSAGTTTHGCVPQMSTSGSPSATSGGGFTITVSLTEGQKSALIFYGVNGRIAQPWGNSGTSLLCVKAPLQRTGVTASSGTFNFCDGAFDVDWNAYIATHPSSLGSPFTAGAVVDAQGWFRDPSAVKNTNLSSAVEFVVLP